MITKETFKTMAQTEQAEYINAECVKAGVVPYLRIENGNVIDRDSEDVIEEREMFDYALDLHNEATAVQGKLFYDYDLDLLAVKALKDFCKSENITLAPDDTIYVWHWVDDEGEHIRVNTQNHSPEGVAVMVSDMLNFSEWWQIEWDNAY